MYDDNAPLIFCEGISGVAGAGDNSIVSFAVNLPSADNTSRTQRVNLRIVMPHTSLMQGVDFLMNAAQQAKVQIQAPPDSVQ